MQQTFIKKIIFIIFKAKNKKNIHPVKIEIDRTEVRQVKSAKFLGFYIDANLDWKQHVRHKWNNSKSLKQPDYYAWLGITYHLEYLEVFITSWHIHTFIMVIFAGEVHIPQD